MVVFLASSSMVHGEIKMGVENGMHVRECERERKRGGPQKQDLREALGSPECHMHLCTGSRMDA